MRKKLTAKDVSQMEDHEYRDLMRGELQRARKNQGKKPSVAGSVVISMILLIAGGAVIMHNLGMIQLQK